MTDFTLTVPAAHIAVLKLFAGVNDVRFYLNGIYVEFGPGGTRLAATDGHRLGVFQHAATFDKPDCVTIPNNLLAHVKAKGDVEITVTLSADPIAPHSVTVSYGGVTASGKGIDGKFPDWRRVLPTGALSGVAAQFNASYVGDLAKAYKLLHTGARFPTACIRHNGEGGALIDLDHQKFVGVLMPMRIKDDGYMGQAPAWAFDYLLTPGPELQADASTDKA